MFKRALLLIMGLLLVFPGVAALANQPASIRQIVIFGDSYSDNGNTYRASGNTYPGQAYNKGRFTNGPTWPAYLSKKLGIDPTSKRFRNYAYGQAQVIGSVDLDTHSGQGAWKFTIPDLSGEVSEYLKEGYLDPKYTLYFIFIGANDFLNYIPSATKKDDEFVEKTFAGLVKQIDRLKKLGAIHIVVFNLRDLQLAPLTQQLAAKYKGNYMSKLNHMIDHYNRLLSSTFSNSLSVMIYDINAFDQKHFNSTSALPCYINKGNYVDVVSITCRNPAKHFFYDRIHPTTTINALIGDSIFKFLQESGWVNHRES